VHTAIDDASLANIKIVAVRAICRRFRTAPTSSVLMAAHETDMLEREARQLRHATSLQRA
jgi:hypothetical protein